MTWLGSWFLTIGGALLRLAGLLFDTLIMKVIIQFKTTLDALNITAAIATGWSVFRDFANILIIGMFVFIAISIILGLKEFGQKRLIANVLIVAVLINFSLLFAKVIIDGSNFFAYQVYSQMAGSANSTSLDISQAFLTPMGITGVWDTKQVTDGVAAQAQATGSSGIGIGFQAFAFGLVGGILLLAVAAVLFYGCFLIASRAVLFIFLMLTAPIAFATYLMPSLSSGEYGWSGWWKSLLNNAAFGPLLMLFLAVSLGIINGAARISNPATIGSIISNPQTILTGSAWQTIMIYLIAIGLLFVSFKFASQFAGTISGFNMASMLPAFGAAAAARVAGFTGRHAIGRPALALGAALQKRSQDPNRSDFARQLFDFSAQRFKNVGKKDFNAMRTPLGSAMAGTAGVKLDTLAGKKIGGAEGSMKKTADNIAKRAERMTPNAETKAKLREEAESNEIKRDPQMAQEHKAATDAHDTAQNQLKTEQTALAAMHEEHTEEMRNLHAALEESRRAATAAPNDEAAVRRATEAEQAIADARRNQEQAIQEQTARIDTAQHAITTADAAKSAVTVRALARARATGRFVDQDTLDMNANKTAHRIAQNRIGSVFFTQGENERLAHEASHHVTTNKTKKRIKETLGEVLHNEVHDITRQMQGDGGHAATPGNAHAGNDHGQAAPGNNADHGDHGH